MTTYKARIGSISSGTMRPEDLVPEFLYTLGQLDKAAHDKLCAEYADVLDADCPDTDSEDYQDGMDYCLEALFDALSEHAPPYCCFGAHEGDVADYGFWPRWDQIRDDVRSGELLERKDWSEDESEQAKREGKSMIEVNDHGNATLYDHEGNEVWSTV